MRRLAYLRWVSLPCRAFIAFETGTHLAAWGEVKHYAGAVLLSSVLLGGGGLVVGYVLFGALAAQPALFSAAFSLVLAPAPALAGALSTTTAVAVGLVFSTAEPTARVDLSHEYHAQGVFTATGLRVGTGIAMLSAAALLFGAPVIITAHNPPLYSLLSSLVSLVLTVVVALLLSAPRRAHHLVAGETAGDAHLAEARAALPRRVRATATPVEPRTRTVPYPPDAPGPASQRSHRAQI